MYEVVVVGAGPSGSAAARYCAEMGLSTLMVEEHAAIGYPLQCAGLLSTAAFAECRVSRDSIIREIRGACINTGDAHILTIDGGATRAYVVDRSRLDREMATLALKAGAQIALKTRVYGIEGNEVLTHGIDGTQRIRTKMIIAADGPQSIIGRMLGMGRCPSYLSGIQADIPHHMDGRFVELYPDASPEFFGWAIPSYEGCARVGLCGERDVHRRFNALCSQFGRGCLHLVTGTIPLGTVPHTYGKRTLLIGDAAGFAKPTSGGGVYTGVRSALHAARSVAECCQANQFDDEILKRYETAWRQDFGRELALGYRLFRMRRQLNPAQIRDICRILNDPEILDIIIRYGDMDRPGELIRRLAIKPSILRVCGALIRSELRGLLKEQAPR